MKTIKRLAAVILTAVLTMGILGPLGVQAADQYFSITTNPENKVLSVTTGENKDFSINIKNMGEKEITDISISPQLRSEADIWPFKTDYQSYISPIGSLKGQEEGQAVFNFTARDDIEAGRYTLVFTITGKLDGQDVAQDQYLFVNVSKKAEEPAPVPSQQEVVPVDAGGFANGEAVYSGGGGGGSTSASVPRVIVTGFSTDPEQVRAGSNFTLTIHLKNTSKSTKVSNMLFDLQAPTEGKDEQTTAPAFLPSSGSNSIYLEGIGADGTADIAISMNAKSDLVQKPYGINLNMKYEDGNAAQIESSSSISIPVKQDARFEFSDFEITPESIEVGEEVNVACSLYNMGRIKLYNVKAIFEGDCIEKEEVFLGNVEPGATASIDAMIKGKKATQTPGKVKMTLKYEDEAGTATGAEKELTLNVTEKAADDAVMSDMQAVQPKSLPVIPIIIVVILVVVVAAVVIIRKRKKKKLLSEEEEGLLDELDRPAEDE